MKQKASKVSLELPLENIDKISAISEQSKESLKGAGAITLTIPSGSRAKFTELRKDFEAYEQSEIDEARSTVEIFIKASQLRIGFHDKLILLAGGCFALSLTFLGLIQRHDPAGKTLSSLGRLKWSWTLLLLSIVFSWLHNLYRCSEVDHVVASTLVGIKGIHYKSAGRWMVRAARVFGTVTESPAIGLSEIASQVAKSLDELSGKSSKEATEYGNRLRRYNRMSSLLGGVALLSIIVAFICLISFALNSSGSF